MNGTEVQSEECDTTADLLTLLGVWNAALDPSCSSVPSNGNSLVSYKATRKRSQSQSMKWENEDDREGRRETNHLSQLEWRVFLSILTKRC